MAEFTLTIKTLIDNKINEISATPTTTAEDVCILLCKQLGISTVARHIFCLRESSKTIYLPAFKTFEPKNSTYDLRIRFKVGDILWLRKIDIKAFDYYFHQAKKDVWDNKIPDLIFEKYHKELLGLGVTDMYRVMLEKDIPQEIVEKDYKKYIPKEVLKRHSFFIRKPIHDALGKIRKSVHDAWYVKEEYLKQLEMMVAEYPIEEYKAYTDQNGSLHTINVRVTPYHSSESGVKYCFDSKREKWILICTIEELGFISIRQDGTVEICRKNGIPFYLKFASLPIMYSFVGLLDGYYRLTVKWTFNICKEVPTPSLQRLYAMKCHGPVGGEFSYAKLEVKRSNQPGCFILRESETKYNILFIDVCLKDSLKPKTYKIERLSEDEFIFNDDLTRYNSLGQLMASYSDPQGPIYLAECLPPSEHDNSPLLLCKKFSLSGDSVTDGSEDAIPKVPVCINTKDLQVYKTKNLKCLKWDKVRKNVRVNGSLATVRKFKKPKFPEQHLGAADKYCRNPDGDIAGPWCFVKYEEYTAKEYCDISFCDDQDCMVFTRNTHMSSHFTAFPKPARQMSFGIKLWDPDSYITATARLVLSILPLPATGKDFEDLGAGIEILLSNKQSALVGGNKDKPEFEPTHGILKSTEYTFFNLNWDRGFLTLFKGNSTKPIFLQEFKTKHNLLGVHKDKFFYYSARGNNIMWSFPFCDDDGECDIHVTTTSKHQNFYPLRQRDIGYDLSFYLRSFHSAAILLVPSPVLDFPRILITLSGRDNLTRITHKEHQKASTITLFEGEFPKLLTFWKWTKFSVTIFSDTLQFFWTKDVGTFVIMSVANPVIKTVRWFSPASEDSVSYWTFYCDPPDTAQPAQAYLPECALNPKETNYVGTQDVTGTGLACLPWSGKNLIPSGIHEKFKDNPSRLLDMVNYCRNPNHEDSGTFCYAISETAEKRVNKYFCSIRKCKSAECRMAGTGNDYIGKVNITRSNRTCQYWVADLPIDLVKKFYDAKKKSNPLEDIDADLTNPIFNSSEIIVDAGVEIKITPNIHELLGKNSTETKLEKQKKQINDLTDISANSSRVVPVLKDVSEEIKTYLNETLNDQFKFVKVHNVNMTHLNDTLYADMSALRARNYCRNPTRSLAGSWCYTMDKDVPRDVCNVPDCDRNEECTMFLKGKGFGQKKEGSEGFTVIYKSMWRHTKGKKMEVAMKVLKSEYRDRFLKEFLELSGQWAFVQSNVIVRLFGVTLTSQLSMVLEYVRLGPLDQYLREHKNVIKVVDLVEVSSNVASALWHLAENNIVHGNIRCRKLLVSCHDENAFTVKLADPGIHKTYSSAEVHWIPVECYSNLDFARRSVLADVWAFATTLWEIFTYGETIKQTDHETAMRMYASGVRLPRPSNCPHDIYNLMRECWEGDVHRRKLPQAITRDINQILYQVYNSRRKHTYDKIKNIYSHSMESIYSNNTESTNVTNQEDLISVFDMSETDADLSTKSSWSVSTLGNHWSPQESNSNEVCGLSNLLHSFDFSTATTSLDGINSIQSIFELDDDCNVVLQGRIGQGFYGEVYKGTLEHIGDKDHPPRLVAVKKLKTATMASCLQDFEREISIMKTLKHPNIVEILGVLQEPEISLVMEFVHHGSLQTYLKIYKETLFNKQLLKYASDIAKGMHYLGTKNIVHRDLAARNILVVDENHVKISDFGLAQVVINDYYILRTDRELPIKWYALESLRDGKFSIKSDVWSYGVTMCEMFSHGEEPMLSIDKTEGPEQQKFLDALERGTRFPSPPNCPQSVYVRIIHPCWLEDPHRRPTFQKLCTEIEELLTQY